MNVAAFIVAAINIPQIIDCSSPQSATFDILFFALDLVLCSQILLRHLPWRKFRNLPLFVHEQYQVAPINHESSLRTMRDAHFRREENLHYENEFVALHSKKFYKVSRSIVRRSSTFPLVKKLRTIIIRFWVTCWGEFIRFPRSIVYHSRFPRILIFVPCFPRAWWSRRRHDRWHLRCQIHHRSCFFALARSSPGSCWARFAIAAMQAVELKWLILNKLNKIIPLITCEIFFCWKWLRVVFWCRCIWCGFWNSDWFDRTTNQK